MMRIIGLLEAKRVLFLLAALLAAALVASTMGLGDAEAKKKKKKKPAATITCVVDKPCNGNSANNTMNGTDGDDQMDGHEGNDTYNPKKNDYFNGGSGDIMTDSSQKSSDTYNLPGSTDGVYWIDDKNGSNDLVNLSPLNLSDQGVTWAIAGVGDVNGDGTDDLILVYLNSEGFTNYVIINDILGDGGAGLKFADDTITESELIGGASALDLPASSNSDEAVSIPRTR